MMDSKALEEKAFEFCEESGCLHGASLTTLLREVAEEARRAHARRLPPAYFDGYIDEFSVWKLRGEGEK